MHKSLDESLIITRLEIKKLYNKMHDLNDDNINIYEQILLFLSSELYMLELEKAQINQDANKFVDSIRLIITQNIKTN